MTAGGRLAHHSEGRLATLIALVGLTTGIAFRFWRLDTASLWMDEAYSRWFSDQSFHYLWTVVPRFETHPPLYYSTLKVWRGLAGDSILALRLPSAIAGCLLLPGAWLTARQFARAMGLNANRARLCAAIALALVAVSPILIDTARQVRPYSFFQLAALACLYAVIQLARQPGQTDARTGYLMSLVLLLWLHPAGVVFGLCFTMALLTAWLATPGQPKRWGWFIAGHVIVAAAYLPVMQIAARAAGAWGKSSWLVLSPRHVAATLTQIIGAPVLPAAIAALLLVLAAWRIATSAGAARRMGALVLWLSVGPLALALLLSLVGPAIFLDRVLSPAVFPLALLFGWLAASHGPRWQALAVLLLIAGMAVSAVTLFPRMAKEDWFALTRRIADHARPGDEIWTYPNVVALPVRYAAAEQGLRLAVRQIPADYPALDFAGDHPLGTTAVVTASPAQLKALVDSSGKVPVIWLVTRMEKRFDPDGALPAALAGRRRLIALRSDGDVTIRAYGGFSGPAQSFGD